MARINLCGIWPKAGRKPSAQKHAFQTETLDAGLFLMSGQTPLLLQRDKNEGACSNINKAD